MRLLFLLIVLAFPVLDLLATARFAQWTGVPMWFWLLTSAVAGLWLMRKTSILSECSIDTNRKSP